MSKFKVAGTDVYFLNSPEFVKQISVVDHERFVKNRGHGIKSSSGLYESLGVKGNRIFEELTGNGILMSEDEYHDVHRRIMQPAFSKDTLASYVPSMTSIVSDWISEKRDGDIVSIRKEMQNLTLKIVLKSLFSLEGDQARRFTKSLAEFGRSGEASHRGMSFFESREAGSPIGETLLALVDRVPRGSKRRYSKAAKALESQVYGFMNERRVKPKKDNDLLTILLASQDVGRLTDSEVKDEILTIIGAGHDTLTNALTWSWYLLASHQTEYAKLRTEVDQVLGRRTPGALDLQKLVYANMIFNEAMRLYPPVWLERRRSVGDVNLGGHQISKGSVVLISQYVAHHDPAYFNDPEKFDPERWSALNRGKIAPFTFFPFGVGPRACIGEPFARLEAPIILSMITQNFGLELADGQVHPGLEPHVTLQPREQIRMRLRGRGERLKAEVTT